jgi:sugar/nucleoside kinase (ribokinase family)
MKITVIGAIVYDEIITLDGARRESFGGITYNLAALSSIVDDGVELHPLTNIAEDRWDAVMELLARYPLVRTDAVARVPGKLTAVRLIYTSPTWRDETVLHVMQPLTPQRVAAARDADAVLVNFVNGNEMDLETFAALRENARGYLHVDIHSKVARWDQHGRKSHVSFDGWQEWVRQVDAVQMNEFECEQLVGRKLSTQEDYVQAGAEIVAAGAPIALITLGPQGSVLVYRREDGIYWVANPAFEVEPVVDTTGCGDSFSAGFTWNYLQSRDPVKANAAANIVGGINCTVAGIGHLAAARDALTQIPTAFPNLGPKIMSGWRGKKL